MARMSFELVFTQHADRSVEPKRAVHINGVTMGPGVRFMRGVAFNGVDIAQYVGHDLEVEEQGEVLIIKGIYQRPLSVSLKIN